ncbi:MAG: DUF4124 domain-containing protein [Gammaproteobacteria bacterium]|nr:DUF4124 domain-containing protein [Gammaproteobacteria bacterium]
METRAIFILLGLLASGAASAQAYKWTDEDGVVHYSDRPHPGAERVVLDQAKPRGPATAGRRTTSAAPPGDDATSEPAGPFSYASLEVAAPAPEETLWNIEGVLSVSLALSPALQPNHQVRVYFDGNARTVRGTSFQLEEVYRGVHNIQAEVLDETGKLMIRSLPNRFYVQQSTVQGSRR